MSGLDREARATRYLEAQEALVQLLQYQPPGLDVPSGRIGYLLSLLADEAKAVIPRHWPGEHSPGVTCANDFDEDDGC